MRAGVMQRCGLAGRGDAIRRSARSARAPRVRVLHFGRTNALLLLRVQALLLQTLARRAATMERLNLRGGSVLLRSGIHKSSASSRATHGGLRVGQRLLLLLFDGLARLVSTEDCLDLGGCSKLLDFDSALEHLLRAADHALFFRFSLRRARKCMSRCLMRMGMPLVLLVLLCWGAFVVVCALVEVLIDICGMLLLMLLLLVLMLR